MADSQWVPFSTSGTAKRKRAGLACILCHSKKIRCDLQAKSNQGQSSCSHCASAGKTCRPRPSKRDKGRSAAEIEGPHSLSASGVDPPGDYQTALVALPFNPPQNNAGSNPDSVGKRVHAKVSPNDQAKPSLMGFDAGLLPQPDWTTYHSAQGPPTNTSQETRLSNAPSVLDAWSASWATPSPEQSHRAQVDLALYPASNSRNIRGSTSTHLSIDPTSRPEKEPSPSGDLQPDLRQSFAETYFEYCYTWCPVLTRATLSKELAKSPLLENAIAIVGSHIRPPLIPQAGPAKYYDRARRLFYDDEEDSLIIALKAVSLFYWWAPRPPSVVHKHSSWWWTSVVIKHAQQAGFYREPAADPGRHDIEPYIRRRIWWTAFARERLTAICQGKPCLIDPADCNIPRPSLQDFPDVEDKKKAEVFVYWVRLCAIIGRIAKRLSRSANSSSTTNTFPADLGKELIDWVGSLPPHLQLPIGSNHTPNFHRDVHQLHLPYLAVIVVLHLTRSSQSRPQALPPATLAGSCIARILKDVLVRSGTRFLMPITCWYVGMGFIALLQASRNECLNDGASADLEILILAMRELKKMWGTAALFEQTFERLRSNDRALTSEDFPNRHLGNEQSTRALNSEEEALHSGIDWIEYFPFVTSQTSVVAEKLLAQQNQDFIFWDGFEEMAFNRIPSYQDFMEGLDSWADPNSFL
ncbi:hypothetical protein FE257_008629 [Aspergillus nanangensis]|uniref:Zn(2)-C6 fungal-type domain-containing protein n=1 Tax=Aspergillus nanangensis TaxID=2582783 RepID=A0AAD4GTB3_ASPNN|nr:hypothetical protein FE257_008629 [Aspergillus nanangensis]